MFLQVDFGCSPPMILKPSKTELRRRYEDGIWALYRSAPHQLQLHAKVHRLQVLVLLGPSLSGIA